MHGIFYRLGYDDEWILSRWFGGKVFIDYNPRYCWYDISIRNDDVIYFNCTVPIETVENNNEADIINEISEEYVATMRFNQCRMEVQ